MPTITEVEARGAPQDLGVETSRRERRIERVITALNHSYNEYRAVHSNDPWETADRREMDEAWAKTFARGQGGYYFTLDVNGNKQAQYLPMHGMMNWLATRATDDFLTPKQKREFQKDKDILERYTLSVNTIDQRRAKSEEQRSSMRSERVYRELGRIYFNPELTTGDPEEDSKKAEERVDNVITQLIGPRIKRKTTGKPTVTQPPAAWDSTRKPDFQPPLVSGKNPWETKTIQPWETKSGQGTIPTQNNPNDGQPAWVTRSAETSAPIRQDETPWGKPDLPKDVEVRTDSELAEKIVASWRHIRLRVAPIRTSDAEPQIIEAQSLSDAMLGYENALTKYGNAQDIDKRRVKRELDLTIKQLERLIGDQEAVKEFVTARREGARKSGKADRGTASKLELRASKLRIERALDRLYELEALKSNEPIILREFTNSDITVQDQYPFKEAQGDLYDSYLEAWRDAEERRITRDEVNPTPRYFIPEVKVRVVEKPVPVLVLVPQPVAPQLPDKNQVFAVTNDEWMKGPVPEPNQTRARRPDREPSKDDLNALEPGIKRPDPIPVQPPVYIPTSRGAIFRSEAEQLNIVFATTDPVWEQEARRNAERQMQIDLAPGKTRHDKIRRVPGIAWTRMVEPSRIREYTRKYLELLHKAGNPYSEVDIKTGEIIQDSHREDYLSARAATGENIELNPKDSATKVERAHGLFGIRMTNKILELADSGMSEEETQKQLDIFITENKYDLNRFFGRSQSDKRDLTDLATNLSKKVLQLRQQVAEGRLSPDQAFRHMDIFFADARWGVETKHKPTKRNRVLDWSREGKGARVKGIIVNPATVGGLTSVGAVIGMSASVVKTALAPISAPLSLGIPAIPMAVGGVAGGIVGGIRRYGDHGRDRITFEIDDASGEKPEGKAPQRERFQRFARDRVLAVELAQSVETILSQYNLSDRFSAEILIAKLAEIVVRKRLSIGRGSDFIGYTSRYQIEQEKLRLNEAVLKGETALRNAGVPYEDYVESLNAQIQDHRERLIKHSDVQDEKFRRDRRIQAVKAIGTGAAMGAAAGGTVVGLKTGIGFGLEVTGLDEPMKGLVDGAVSGVRGFLGFDSTEIGGKTARTAVKNGFRPSGQHVYNMPLPDDTDSVDPLITNTIPEVTKDSELYTSYIGNTEIRIPKGTWWRPDINGKHDLILSTDGRVLINDAYIDGTTGELNADPKSVWDEQIVNRHIEITNSEHVLGKDGVWKDSATQIDGKTWDRNGTIGRYEGTELDLTVGKQDNAVIFHLPKGTKGIFISRDGHLNNPIWIEGKNGVVRLDPDDMKHFVIGPDGKRIPIGNIAKMVVDQDELGKYQDGNLGTELHPKRRAIFNVDTVEAGSLDTDKAGKVIARIKATIKGAGQLPSDITTGTEDKVAIKVVPTDIPHDTEPPHSPEPTPKPTPEPTSEPTPRPTPTAEPTPTPTTKPTPIPTPEPTPTPTPTPEPTPVPTPRPTPVPTPEPSPEPTPVSTSEPTATPSPSPEPTPSPTPSSSPQPGPIIPPATGGGFTFDPTPLISVPFVARNPLEVTKRDIAPAVSHTIYSGPTLPTPASPAPHASPVHLSGTRFPERIGIITDEVKGKVHRLDGLGYKLKDIATVTGLDEDTIMRILGINNSTPKS